MTVPAFNVVCRAFSEAMSKIPQDNLPAYVLDLPRKLNLTEESPRRQDMSLLSVSFLTAWEIVWWTKHSPFKDGEGDAKDRVTEIMRTARQRNLWVCGKMRELLEECGAEEPTQLTQFIESGRRPPRTKEQR